MNTKTLRTLIGLSFIVIFYACKKGKVESPDKIVNYQIAQISGPSTFLKYIYDTTNTLVRVTGKDSDKSLACSITYEGNKVLIDYQNFTANEKWNIELDVNEKGYFTRFNDGLFMVDFMYDSTRFSDKKTRLVTSYCYDGKYKGDTLFNRAVFDENDNLTKCYSYGMQRDFVYYTDEDYTANLSTFYVETILNRFNRIIAYLPYTFGEMPKYLPKTVIEKGAYYTEYTYQKDEFGRVEVEYKNGATYNYTYLK
ncbi:MAG: hypothetical protein M9887_07625 [Chitinophagales bacterium]|nr:hypothetical protein [Chitinophagales bacterium]